MYIPSTSFNHIKRQEFNLLHFFKRTYIRIKLLFKMLAFKCQTKSQTILFHI